MEQEIHWQCDKPLSECECKDYFDGIIEYTFLDFSKDEYSKNHKNGYSDYRVNYYCPGCGLLKEQRWSGGRGVGSFCFGAIAIGCIECDTWIYTQNEDLSKFRLVDCLCLSKPIEKTKYCKSPKPNKVNGKYICGCCDESIPFSPGNLVTFYSASGPVFGDYIVKGHYRQSDGHIIWKLDKQGETSPEVPYQRVIGHDPKHTLIKTGVE
jgi:hypothetical protein